MENSKEIKRVTVTEDGVIVAAEAVTEASDMNQLQPMIEQSTQNSNELVKEVAADSGYENYEYLESKGIEGHVPDLYFNEYKKGNYEEDRYHYSNFVYDKEEDSYTCPEGK